MATNKVFGSAMITLSRLTTKQFTHGEDGFKNEGRTDASSCASDFHREYFKYLPEVKGSNTFKQTVRI